MCINPATPEGLGEIGIEKPLQSWVSALRRSRRTAGRVGFGVDMGATRSLRSTDKSGEALEATAGALLEADRRQNDPIREFQFWRAVYLLPNTCVSSLSSVKVTGAINCLPEGHHTVNDAHCCKMAQRPC